MNNRKDDFLNNTGKWPRTGDSLGNLETKIDFLINLNLQLMNLVVSLSVWINQKETLPENVLKELQHIQSILPKLFTTEGSKLVLMESIQTLGSKLQDMMEDKDTPITDEKSLEKAISPNILAESEEQDFTREEVTDDRWGIIESIDSILRTYSNLSHLAFPFYYFVACKEVLNHKVIKEISSLESTEITQIPALRLKNLILKLLREAPSARLLQNLKKIYPLEEGRTLEQHEEASIREIVQKYYSNISDYLEGRRTLIDATRVSTSVLNEYNLGPGDLESRIPNVSFIIAKEVHSEFKAAKGNEFRQFIFSETIVLIHRLNESILQNERYKLLLRMIK